MSDSGIVSSLLGLIGPSNSITARKLAAASSNTSSTTNANFASSLAVSMASLQAQSVNALIGDVVGSGTTVFSPDLLTGSTSFSSGSDQLQSLLTGGRNLALFDPESAYRMMSNINNKDVTYKAQYSELNEMSQGVKEMQTAGLELGSITDTADNSTITAKLQAFVGKYNDWISRFDSTVKNNGLLAGTQAAEISLYELEQSIENPFNGAKDGIHGLSGLGINIDQTTDLASIDSNRLNTTLASNRAGVIGTIQAFSANFAKSAELLNSAGNFIPNRLSNLDHVIDYISEHKTSLQAEFGLGDPAKPNAQVAKALANYNRVFGTAA